jgi:hypothetical protein
MERGLRGLVLVVMLLALGAIAWAQGGATPGEGAGQDAAAPPPSAPLSYNTVTSMRYGFSIALPALGTILTPESSNWPWADLDETMTVTEDEDADTSAPKTAKARPGAKLPPGKTQPAKGAAATPPDTTPDVPASPSRTLHSGVAFHWYGTGPVKEVLVHCYSFQTQVMDVTFKSFTDALHQDFTAADREKEEKKAQDKTAAVKKAVGMDKDLPDFVVTPATPPQTTDGSRWTGINVKDQRDPESPVYYSILSTYGGNRVYSVTLFYMTPRNQAIENTGGAIINTLRSPDMTGPYGVEPIILDLGTAGTLGQPGMRPADVVVKPAGA